MINYKNLIHENGNKGFNVKDDLKNISVEEIRKHQPKFPFAICTLNIDGSLNIGNIIRSAVIFGAEKFFVAGRNTFNKCSTVGAQNYIEIERISALKNETEVYSRKILDRIVECGYTPTLIDNSFVAKNIHEINEEEWNTKPCFIFGNEGMGIDQEMIDISIERNYKFYSIEQYGVMRSLNVSVAAGIVMFEYSKRFNNE